MNNKIAAMDYENNKMQSYNSLELDLQQASAIVGDIVLKKYLDNLTDFEISPISEELNNISDIRLFKITEMVYQNNEYSTYKFASVFNSVQNLNCGVFILLNSDGTKTDFYMGVRSLDDKRTTKSLKDTLKNTLRGQFPGIKTQDLLDKDAQNILCNIPSASISSVSCVPNNKDSEYKDNDSFIQGLEKLALAMQGYKYSAVMLSKSISNQQLDDIRNSYEKIYTQLSPFENMQLSYGSNQAITISNSFSSGVTKGTSYTKGTSETTGSSHTKSKSISKSVSQTDKMSEILKGGATGALGIASILTAPLTGGISLAAAGLIMSGNIATSMISPKPNTESSSDSESFSYNQSNTTNENYGENKSNTETTTETQGQTQGITNNMQLTMKNKTLIDILKKIDLQLERIDECESIGMWESSAYFLSDNQETTEMVAGTYKALMTGENSGLETSAINYWGSRNNCLEGDKDKNKNELLYEYITNFIHPVFKYNDYINVTATSITSSNELAIQMGLPRKSVCGFPVINHADFGKEVVRYNKSKIHRDISLGKIFSMGNETKTDVRLDCDSLAMHTFITGSTGSGKSNTVYKMLNTMKDFYRIPFLVIEPAKGEYKNVFGQFSDVSVYGTNPKKTDVIRINPFSFPEDVHVLEHMERLVDIFNVCWPMYAAMPAILKSAMERSYKELGWDLIHSENSNGRVFPNFNDLLEKIEDVIDESKYSADNKGDYAGALITRVNSLTSGLNSIIFSSDEINNEELFDKNVIVDLSRVGSNETKSLIMGLLVMKLNEYRMSCSESNSPLRHITVLEEAHNLLKRSQVETGESNLSGKSVELLSNSIAEMRTYGEGFIIADQSPNLLDMSAIRNTNTKIILRLPEKSDRELVGYAAGLTDEQIEELSKLRRGVCAVYQNDWVEPVLVQVEKCKIEEKKYSYIPKIKTANCINIKTQIINFLIHTRVNIELDFNLDDILKNMDKLHLSSKNILFIKKQIEEYRNTNDLEIWKLKKFNILAEKITDILDCRNIIENIVVKSSDFNELNNKLITLVSNWSPNIDDKVKVQVIKCLLKDMTVRDDERQAREKIYIGWCESIERKKII